MFGWGVIGKWVLKAAPLASVLAVGFFVGVAVQGWRLTGAVERAVKQAEVALALVDTIQAQDAAQAEGARADAEKQRRVLAERIAELENTPPTVVTRIRDVVVEVPTISEQPECWDQAGVFLDLLADMLEAPDEG